MLRAEALSNIAYKPLTGLVTGDLRAERPESGRGTSSTCQLVLGGGEKLGQSWGRVEERGEQETDSTFPFEASLLQL